MIGFTDPTTPATATDPLAELRADNRRLRALVQAVAEDLERIACEERYAPHVAPLRARATRLRRYLHSGVPEV